NATPSYIEQNDKFVELKPPFIDPPLGGFAQKTPMDRLPWYYNEGQIPDKLSDKQLKVYKHRHISNGLLYTDNPSEQGVEAKPEKDRDRFTLIDQPYDPGADKSEKVRIVYKTWLAGVDKAGKLIRFFGGVQWEYRNSGGVAGDVYDAKWVSIEPSKE